MKQTAKYKKSHKKRIVWLGVILIPLLAAATAYAYHQHNKPKPAQTTSTSKTAQSDYSGGKKRPTDGQSTGNSQGGAVDNKGDTTTPTDTTPAITSTTGAITVLGVPANSIIKNGDVLRGTVKGVTQVQFRVIDESVGVLAQGALSVVNGSFSGTLKFTPKAATGRLDVFSFDAAGAEINNIEIPVRFE